MNKVDNNKDIALTEDAFQKLIEEMKEQSVYKTKGDTPVHSDVISKQKGKVQGENKKDRIKENALARKGVEF